MSAEWFICECGWTDHCICAEVLDLGGGDGRVSVARFGQGKGGQAMTDIDRLAEIKTRLAEINKADWNTSADLEVLTDNAPADLAWAVDEIERLRAELADARAMADGLEECAPRCERLAAAMRIMKHFVGHETSMFSDEELMTFDALQPGDLDEAGDATLYLVTEEAESNG